MATKRLKRPRDPIALAKLIGDIATGQIKDEAEGGGPEPAAVEFARQGGLRGGPARAAILAPKRRAEIARKAAKARWARVKAKKAPK